MVWKKFKTICMGMGLSFQTSHVVIQHASIAGWGQNMWEHVGTCSGLASLLLIKKVFVQGLGQISTEAKSRLLSLPHVLCACALPHNHAGFNVVMVKHIRDMQCCGGYGHAEHPRRTYLDQQQQLQQLSLLYR